MSDELEGIPEDLDRQALSRLGRFAKPVQALVRRVNNIHWMARAGMEEPWDDQVIRLRYLSEAKMAYREFLEVYEAAWGCQGEIGRVTGRADLLKAAEDYWIARFHPRFDEHVPSYTHDLLLAPVHSDIVGALRELVLSDIVPSRFFREAIIWYEKGHWRAAINADGKRLVY